MTSSMTLNKIHTVNAFPGKFSKKVKHIQTKSHLGVEMFNVYVCNSVIHTFLVFPPFFLTNIYTYFFCSYLFGREIPALGWFFVVSPQKIPKGSDPTGPTRQLLRFHAAFAKASTATSFWVKILKFCVASGKLSYQRTSTCFKRNPN